MIHFRCAPGWELKEELPYTLYWMLFGFLIPLTVIIASSVKTIRRLKEVHISNCTIGKILVHNFIWEEGGSIIKIILKESFEWNSN